MILLVPFLVLGACGESKDKADSTDDLAIAKSAQLTAADLTGYDETPYEKSHDTDLPAASTVGRSPCR